MTRSSVTSPTDSSSILPAVDAMTAGRSLMRGTTLVSPTLSSQEYVKQALQIPGMKGAVAKLGAAGNPSTVAAAVEFVLEGLHLNRKLNKERGESRSTFRA